MKAYTLVIIDVQPHFSSARRNYSLLNNCKREIEIAKKNRFDVFLVRLGQYGRVSSVLTEAVSGYDRKKNIVKYKQSGAKEILQALSKPQDLRFCGVNTNLCVADTVIEIAGKFPSQYTLQVVTDACACWSDISHRSGLSRMNKLDNIVLI